MLDDKPYRRSFIKRSSLITAGSVLIPQFLKDYNQNNSISFNGKRLVIIQLSGGNDGLNTVIPYRNDNYYRMRPNIGLPKFQVLPINDELGFNPGMQGCKSLFDEGELCLINNVGYPNPSRSHFRSLDIWHSASASNEYLSSGWLGRYLDHECNNCNPHTAIEIEDNISLAMRGNKAKGFSISNPGKMYQATRHLKIDNYIDGTNDNLNFLYKTLAETKETAAYVFEKSKIYKSHQLYPSKQLGRKLKTVAELIISGIETEIFYVSFTGFDTHANQVKKHQNLLNLYSDSLAAFAKDLKANNQWDNTLILTFSEFGRRVKENAGKGTDHGAANMVFLSGGGLKKPGVFNEGPDLNSLDRGDLKYNVDFRSIYATLLDKWFETDSSQILGNSFPYIDLL